MIQDGQCGAARYRYRRFRHSVRVLWCIHTELLAQLDIGVGAYFSMFECCGAFAHTDQLEWLDFGIAASLSELELACERAS